MKPPEFVATCHALFREASDRAGATTHDFVIANRKLRLTFAGPALESHLVMALSHLAAATTSEPVVHIWAWDSRSTGVSMPDPPWSWDRLGPRGEVEGFNTGPVRCAYHPGPATLSVFDATAMSGYLWTPDAQLLPWYEAASPLRVLMHWWLEAANMQMVHGAAVGTGGGGLLLAGEGGAGKSSTALACLRSGWSYVSDDYCAVEIGTRPIAHSLYSTAKADLKALEQLGELARTATPHTVDRGRSMLQLWPDQGHRIAASLPIDAILMPHVVERGDTAIRPAAAVEAIAALAPSTMRQLPGTGAHAWRALSRLAHAVPAFHLDLGADVDQIPAVMATALHAGRMASA